MLLKGGSIFDFQSGEKLPGIAVTAVVGGEHLKCHGLSKTAWSADTEKLLFCTQIFIGILEQPRFIHINFGLNRIRKIGVLGFR